MSSSAPRLRFAPSPTGFFHVGSARSSLFNWLHARQHGGTFVLRIEDTDAERNREEWVQGIVEAMHWLGLDPDERPYRQSEFAEDHRSAAQLLFDSGAAYACSCTREEIDARAEGAGRVGYDGFCRERGLAREGNLLRFATPRTGTTVVADLIRGNVEFSNADIEDFAIARSDGSVLFALANLVDDRSMGITHVFRAEEHLANTPKQILMSLALDRAQGIEGELPVYAHMPLLVNEQRKKLSKRRDPVAVESYRDEGYLADAMVNFLALLGWSPKGDREKVDRDVLLAEFSIDEVNHSPAFFDVAKLRNLNGQYIRELSVEQFIDATAPWVAPRTGEWAASTPPPWPSERFDAATYARIAPLVQERVAVLSEVTAMVDFLFLEDAPIDSAAFDKAMRVEGSRAVLEGCASAFAGCAWDPEAIRASIEGVGEPLGLNMRKTQAPVRVALTGRSVGPPLFESIELLGRDESIRRLGHAIGLLG